MQCEAGLSASGARLPPAPDGSRPPAPSPPLPPRSSRLAPGDITRRPVVPHTSPCCSQLRTSHVTTGRKEHGRSFLAGIFIHWQNFWFRAMSPSQSPRGMDRPSLPGTRDHVTTTRTAGSFGSFSDLPTTRKGNRINSGQNASTQSLQTPLTPHNIG